MKRSTLGRLLIDDALPPDMQGGYEQLDKAGVSKLFNDLALRHPEKYREVAKRLTDVARDVAQATGGFSFGLDHMRPSAAGERVKDQVRRDLQRVMGRMDLSPDDRERAVTGILAQAQKPLEDAVYQESVAEGNPLAHQVRNVGRGNKSSLKALRSGDLLYEDHQGRPIPIAALSPYSKGLDPSEYFAASFGARKGVVDVKLCLFEDTQVRMADGSTRMIKDIIPGDLVLGWDVERFRPVPVVVLANYDNGERECVRFCSDPLTDTGPGQDAPWELIATPEHRVLSQVFAESAIARQPGPICQGMTWATLPLAEYEAGRSALIRPATSILMPGAFDLIEAKKLIPLLEDDAIGQYGWWMLHFRGLEQRPFERVGPRRTRDLEVAHRDHLFVLANGLIVSNSTAQSGYFGKQLSQVSHRLVVTDQDHEDDGVDRSDRGLPVATDDSDNVGALLARPAGPYGRNTILTPAHLAKLRAEGVSKILVRSPTVGGPVEGGVLARDVGVRERGGLSPRGDYVGLAAAHAIAEKVSQGTLCLWEETLVRMADWSTKPLKDIKVGELVLGADRTGRTFPVAVTAVFDNGLRDCYRTTFGLGQTKQRITLESTLDHKMLCLVNKWSCLAQSMNGKLQILPVGHVGRDFSAVMANGLDDESGDDEPFSLLMGLGLGDGCYTKSVNGAFLSCFDDTLPPALDEYLRTLNLRLHLCAGQRGYYRISQIEEIKALRSDEGRFETGYRNPAMACFERYAMLGKYAHEKTIPDQTYRWNKKSISCLLGGLFVTDGSVYLSASRRKVGQPYISFGSTSRKMLDQILELLEWKFGIYASTPFENNKERKHTLHQVTISTQDSMVKFFKAIPLFGVKQQRLKDFVDAWTPGRRLEHRRCGRKAKEHLGFLPTRDIEVSHPDHLFVLANGLIVSNSSKHAGGVAGQGGVVSGFKLLDAMAQIPKVFPGGAAHSQIAGTVNKIEPAPQGGQFIHVGSERYYAAHGQDATVSLGDKVEPGDVLSDGLPNPAEIVKHKGVGEGRKHFVTAFGKALAGAGVKANRRNVELLARGLIDHVQLDEEIGPHNPDDILPYQALEAAYEPREDAKERSPKESLGRYLERPVLHHTLGTQVRPSMLKDMEDFGIKQLLVHDDPPPFRPVMIRAKNSLEEDPDWMTRHLGSNLQRSTLEAAHRGRTSDTAGTSFVPALAERAHFGRTGPTRGWDPRDRDHDGRVNDGRPDEKAAWSILDDVF